LGVYDLEVVEMSNSPVNVFSVVPTWMSLVLFCIFFGSCVSGGCQAGFNAIGASIGEAVHAGIVASKKDQ
jgi:hypothetical protein